MQKWTRYTIATSLLSRYKREGFPFLHRIIAVDETWVYCYDPELKRQSAEWRGPDEPRPTKFKHEPSALKQMMIFAYTSERGIIADHVTPLATVNKEYYGDFIRRLRIALHRKQPDIQRAGPLLLHDNATCHAAETVHDRLAAYDWEILPHPHIRQI